MTPRDRVLCTLRGGQADRVPYDLTHCSNGLGGFNREAARLFRERTGSDNPDEYFGVERDVAWVHLQDTRLDLIERYAAYHQLPAHLTYCPRETRTRPQRRFPCSNGVWPWCPAQTPPMTTSSRRPAWSTTDSLAEIEQYPLPDFDAEYRYAHLGDGIGVDSGAGIGSPWPSWP